MASTVIQYGSAVNRTGLATINSIRLYETVFPTENDIIVACVAGDVAATSVVATFNPLVYTSHEIEVGDTTFDENIGSTLGDWRWAYRFTPTEAIEITGFSLYFGATIGTTGTIYYSIKAVDGNNNPTGSDLVAGSIASSSLAVGYRVLNFSTPYTVTANVTYCLCWSATAQCTTQFRTETNAGNDHPYTLLQSINSGSTWSTINSEPLFRLYVGPSGTVNFTKDAEASYSGVTTQIWSAQAMTREDVVYDGHVTATFPSEVNCAMTTYLVTEAEVGASRVDKTNSATGTNAPYNTGTTGTLSNAYEALIAVIGIEEESDQLGTWTSGSGYVSGLPLATGSSGGGAKSISIATAAQISTSTTSMQGNMSAGAPDWAALIVSYYLITNFDVAPSAVEAKTVALISTTIDYSIVIAKATALDPIVEILEPSVFAPLPVSAGTYTYGTASIIGVLVEPSAAIFTSSTTYTTYRRLRVGWARVELDLSGVIYIFPSAISAATSVVISNIIHGSITLDLVSKFASSAVGVIDPYVDEGGVSLYKLRRWNGTDWIQETFYVYDGSQWIEKSAYVYLDSQWEQLA